jgi:hypothetical protein
MLSIFLSAGSRAWAVETPAPVPSSKQPIAKVFFMGVEYSLYPTATPNYYRDQFRELWIPVIGDPQPGHAKYLYKKIQFA